MNNPLPDPAILMEQILRKDPLNLTQQDLEAYVLILQNERAAFLVKEREAKPRGKVAKAPLTKATDEDLKNLLDDL